MFGTFIDYFVKKNPGKYGFQLECYGEGKDDEAEKIADGLLEAIKLAAPLDNNQPTSTNKPPSEPKGTRPPNRPPQSSENEKKAFDKVQDSDLNKYVSENTFDDAAKYVEHALYPKFEI